MRTLNSKGSPIQRVSHWLFEKMISSWSKPNSRHNLKLSLNLCDFVASPTFQLQTLSISLQIFKIYPILTQIRVVETTLVPHLSPTGARSYLLMLSSPKKTLFVNIFFIPVEVYTGHSLRHGLSLRAEEM